jgi:hypothetical protein
VKYVWGRGEYIQCCDRSERRGLLEIRALKIERPKRENCKRNLSLVCGSEDAKHVILGCGETASWRAYIKCKK